MCYRTVKLGGMTSIQPGLMKMSLMHQHERQTVPLWLDAIHDEVRYSHKVCLAHEELPGVFGVPARAKQSRVPVPHWLYSRAVEDKVPPIIDMHAAPVAHGLVPRDPKALAKENKQGVGSHPKAQQQAHATSRVVRGG